MTTEDKTQEKWEVQLRKGSLELVILAALQQRTLYGLELLKVLQSFKSTAITEGTLYPLLDRLKREQLLDAARGRSIEAFDRSIDLLVSRLRQKLGDDPKAPQLIKTVRGGGYLFTPSVSGGGPAP